MVRLEYGTDYIPENQRELIVECETIKDAFVGMSKHLEKINFKSYYQRVTMPNESDKNKEIWIDYGSHSHFYYINGFTDDEYKNWLNGMRS